MAILSMKMLAALQAAKAAGAMGLRHTEAGWLEDSKPAILHSGPTVSSLVERGDLAKQRSLRADGSRCFLTQRGYQSLAEAEAGMRRAM